MADKTEDLHGNAPDNSPLALLIIDMINDFEFPGGDRLYEFALPAAHRIADLKRDAKSHGIPTVYVNDNWGRWRSDFASQVLHCLKDDVCGAPIARLLRPEPDDYFVLKPKHSAFYATPLDVLLTHLKARTLILTGVAGNSCILFSASDAYIRDYHLVIPSDCVASQSVEENERCLLHMRDTLDANIRPSKELLGGLSRLAESQRS